MDDGLRYLESTDDPIELPALSQGRMNRQVTNSRLMGSVVLSRSANRRICFAVDVEYARFITDRKTEKGDGD